MVAARQRVDRFARTALPVLLVGPTGAGKEVMARHLHAMSERAGRFMDVNCGALPRDMVESLLFGHRRGAFTGAIESVLGLIGCADRGTLFLDELTSLPVEGQAKLLRVLETGELTPLGSTVKTRIDFRLIAAVQEDVLARVEMREFRRDLLHRIEGVVIQLPPLRARSEDIEPLANYFAARQGCVLESSVILLLRRLDWPGNVRQLRSVIDRACILADDSRVGMGAVAEALEGGIDIRRVPEVHDRERFVEVCRSNGNDGPRVAAALGISRATLYRRLKIYGVRLGTGDSIGRLIVE